MTPKSTSRVLVVLSMCYGITIAILAMLGSPAIGFVAAVGALVLGLLWAIRGMFFRRSDP